jgi:hypothetical protein
MKGIAYGLRYQSQNLPGGTEENRCSVVSGLSAIEQTDKLVLIPGPFTQEIPCLVPSVNSLLPNNTRCFKCTPYRTPSDRR